MNFSSRRNKVLKSLIRDTFPTPAQRSLSELKFSQWQYLCIFSSLKIQTPNISTQLPIISGSISRKVPYRMINIPTTHQLPSALVKLSRTSECSKSIYISVKATPSWRLLVSSSWIICLQIVFSLITQFSNVSSL